METLTKAARMPEVFAVVVDGIADFIPDTNDLKESEALVRHLMGLVKMHKVVLVLVITKTQESLATILQIKKDGETHTISTRQNRGAPIIGDDAIRCR